MLGVRWYDRWVARRAARDAVVRAARLAVAHASFGPGPALVWETADLTELARLVRLYERADQAR